MTTAFVIFDSNALLNRHLEKPDETSQFGQTELAIRVCSAMGGFESESLMLRGR